MADTVTKNIFVIGLDAFDRRLLEKIHRADRYAFYGLLGVEEVASLHTVSVTRLLKEARTKLSAFGQPIDAIVGFWDLPTSAMLPILRREHGLPGPSLESVLRCEHKYWSRLEQHKVILECAPLFEAVDPEDNQAGDKLGLEYPIWIKPVKSYCSQLGFKVRNAEDLDYALTAIRAGIDRIALPFDEILAHANIPPEVAEVGARYCIAEQLISSGWQCTLEGYVLGGEVTVYGVVDSLREGEEQSSFSSYQYPTDLPDDVVGRMVDATSRFLRHIEFDGAPFNAEFFYDKLEDRVWLLEVNPRISKSHSPLFEMVDGASHQQIMVEVALGEKPQFPSRQGPHQRAAKFMMRRYGDALATRVPTHDEIDALEHEIPGTRVVVPVKEGMRLSQVREQDSYSYVIADVFVGGADRADLDQKYRKCVAGLDFGFEPVMPPFLPS